MEPIYTDFKEISSISWKNILKTLKLYKDLTKMMGKRGKEVFDNKVFQKSIFKVEYYPCIDIEIVRQMAVQSYLDFFKTQVIPQDIIFSQNTALGWGMRVYKNSEMLDLSLVRVEKFLKV